MNNIISSRRMPVASAAKVWLRAFAAALLLLCFAVRQAHAVEITLGSRIDLTSTAFVLPIQIVDAIGVSEWSLDLNYDPTDVQVNVGCDPFGGDSYCSLLTGPVTEGDFFAAGAPFNLLIPGFVELDPITFAQSGRLFGLHGAFGGGPPAPSGNGILAYIEFILLGTGDSPIEPGGGTVVSDPEPEPEPVPVPEPGSLALLAMGLALGLLVMRRRAAVVAGVAVASLSMGESAIAQAFPPAIDLPDLPPLMPAPSEGWPQTVAQTAAATYLTPPAWSQTLAPNVRFVILSNFNNDAVLDRETGLIWMRRSWKRLGLFGPNAFERPIDLCRVMPIGDRFGWRLPAVAELQSLLDMSVPLSSAPSLPVGHPFWLSPGGTNPDNFYWTGEAFFTEVAGDNVFVRRVVELREGRPFARRTPQTSPILSADILCVRGGRTPVPDAPDSPQ